VAGERLHDESVAVVGPDSGHIDYEIPRLGLLPGAYHLAATVRDRHTGHVYDSGQRLVVFDVVPGESRLDSVGYFGLDGAWRGGVRA
jgi:hypothetical protein